jgi:hypothetical protein
MTQVPFFRNVVIQFDDQIYRSGYRLSFTVTKKLSGKNRNSARIQIYNPDVKGVREAIGRKGRRFIQIRAGYGVTEPPIIFAGYAVPDGSILNRNGPDNILVVEAKGFGSGPSAKARPKAITIEEALTAENLLAAGEAAFGVAFTFVEPALSVANVGTRTLTGKGWAFTGSFEDFVVAAGKKLGADFQVQKGRATFVPKRKTQGSTGQIFSADNGRIIDSPSPRPKGKTRFKVLLSPDLEAGYRFLVEDDVFGGVYRAESVVHSGDVGFSNEYYTSIEARIAPKVAKDGQATLFDPMAPFEALGRGIGRAANFANEYLNNPAAGIFDLID